VWIPIATVDKDGWYVARYATPDQPYRVIRVRAGKKRSRRYSHRVAMEVWSVPVDDFEDGGRDES